MPIGRMINAAWTITRRFVERLVRMICSLRDFSLRIGLRWSLISKFMKTRISQAAAAIPLIGYALLWSQEFSDYFVLRSVLGDGIWFDTTDRLLLIYFGSLLLAAAWAVYLFFCPALLKSTPDVNEYLVQRVHSYSKPQLKQIHGTLNDLIERDPPHDARWKDPAPVTLKTLEAKSVAAAIRDNASIAEVSLVFQANFLWNEVRRFWALLTSACLIGVGTPLVLIPSCEVFALVVARVLQPKLGF
jgi:hypothetical protein